MEELKEASRTTVKEKTKLQSKKERLLANINMKRWYDNIARGSVLTADQRLYKLGQFCDEHKMTPNEFANLAIRDAKTAEDIVQDHITAMEDKGSAPSTMQHVVTTVRSWLEYNHVRLTRTIKIRNLGNTPTLDDESVPNAEELAEMFNRASLRVAAIEALMAKAGLRPEVLGNYNATDGLMMKDLPDIVIQQGVAKCLQSPPKIIVRKTLSKVRHQCFTFLTSDGTKKLLAYLNDRLAKGHPTNSQFCSNCT